MESDWQEIVRGRDHPQLARTPAKLESKLPTS
jgi:hypothetical protein